MSEIMSETDHAVFVALNKACEELIGPSSMGDFYRSEFMACGDRSGSGAITMRVAKIAGMNRQRVLRSLSRMETLGIVVCSRKGYIAGSNLKWKPTGWADNLRHREEFNARLRATPDAMLAAERRIIPAAGILGDDDGAFLVEAKKP